MKKSFGDIIRSSNLIKLPAGIINILLELNVPFNKKQKTYKIEQFNLDMIWINSHLSLSSQNTEISFKQSTEENFKPTSFQKWTFQGGSAAVL